MNNYNGTCECTTWFPSILHGMSGRNVQESTQIFVTGNAALTTRAKDITTTTGPTHYHIMSYKHVSDYMKNDSLLLTIINFHVTKTRHMRDIFRKYK